MTGLQIFLSVVSPLLVLFGWLFVYGNSNRIAKRSEAYALITKAVDKALALDKRCADYWLGDPDKRDPARSWLAGTSAEIHGLRALLDLLEKHHAYSDKKTVVMNIRMAATTSAEEVADLQLSEIEARRAQQSQALSYSLDSLYGYYRILND
ncbi:MULTISPECIES: hypothetical protein [Pseudomonas]|uniref:Uncharacterized protein n=2 Tax=Pseudomonas TaxID=286 RepID=A0ABS1GQM8_9PSED|nr:MULTISPECIES: hypothetical protein [Pseudomonas]MBK3459288.1 hypothetical protein [Pseudomonas haemolytica]MDD1943737.1 hypothetical protein [Pseudomonas carnis]